MEAAEPEAGSPAADDESLDDILADIKEKGIGQVESEGS